MFDLASNDFQALPIAFGVAGVLGSLLLIAVSVFLAPRLVASLSVDHFNTPQHPAPRNLTGLVRAVLLNVVGVGVFLLGVVMLFTPGPGIILILAGLSIARFPGKHRLTRQLVAHPRVMASLNWMRKRHDRPPFLPLEQTRRDSDAPDNIPSILVGLILTAALLPPPADAQSDDKIPSVSADDVATRISETMQRLEALDRELEANRAERERLAQRVSQAESAADERRTRVSGLDQDITRFEAELQSLESRIAAERANVDARRERIKQTVRQAHQAEDTNPMAVLFAHEDPALADRLSVWTGYVVRAQRQDIDIQREAIARVESAHQRALKDRNWLAHIRRKAARQRDGQISKSASTRAELSSVDERITETTRSVETLRADADRLTSLLDELRAAEAARSGYFEAGKGGWPMPANGQVTARFGDAKSVGNLLWDGWFIRAEAGRPVTAVADGEVVYSDWLRGFGMLVIVDHGDSYMSLYGGNRQVTAAAGDWVESGATIATVGDSGGQSSSGLYFEIRHDANPLDPAPWLVN